MGSTENRVRVLFSYVVQTDSGFAPNPFFGVCTLACCKPALRRSVGRRLVEAAGGRDLNELRLADPGFISRQGIWVVGLAGAALHDRPRRSVVYVMQVTDVLDFESYYDLYPQKRPVRSGGATPDDPRWHGDAIYTGNDPQTARQLVPCAHSDGDQENVWLKQHDLGGRHVLLSDHFIYFGQDAPYLPLEERLHHGRGHTSNHPTEALAELESLLNGEWSALFHGAADEVAAAVPKTQDCRAVL